MIAVFTNKSTGQVQIVSQVAEYTEMYNFTLRKWFHSVSISGTGNNILFESKTWKVLLREVLVKEATK